VLIVDDSPEDASLIMQELAHSQFQVSRERVENGSRLSAATADRSRSHPRQLHFVALQSTRALQLLQRTGMSIPFNPDIRFH
jgi:hypothetical protein